MKTKASLLLVLMLMLVIGSSAFARIGETEQEIEKRYGKSVRCEHTKDPTAECCTYSAGRFTIKVYFINHYAAALLINTPKGSQFSQDEIGVFLNANSGDQLGIDDLLGQTKSRNMIAQMVARLW